LGGGEERRDQTIATLSSKPLAVAAASKGRRCPVTKRILNPSLEKPPFGSHLSLPGGQMV
jgi:hypothetical protein